MAQPALHVDIAFFSDPWVDTPLWRSMDAYVLAIPSIKRGRSREGGRFEAGTATVILDNDSGEFSPGNAGSFYAAGLLPMRKVQIWAVWNAVTYALFTGYITRWEPSEWDGLTNRMTLECVDGFKRLAQQKITYSQGATNGRFRLSGVLNVVGWPTADRDIGSADSTVTAVALVGQPPLAHLHEVNDAEDGAIFVNGAGVFTFQRRNYRIITDESIDVQATFGMDPAPTVGWMLGSAMWSILTVTTIPRAVGWVAGVSDELPYTALEPSYDDQFLVNDAQITAAGGTGPQVATDADSQARYGVYSKVATYILTNDIDALSRAVWMVFRNKDARYRFLSLTTSGHMDDALWPHVLGLEISDRVAVYLRPGAGAVVYSECYIEAIEQRDLTRQTWETVFSLSPAVNDLFWILNVTGRNILGVSTRLKL